MPPPHRAGRRPLLRAALLIALLPLHTACVRHFPLARPSLERFVHYRQPASDSGAVRVHFFGVTSLLIRDDTSAVISDGFVTRPGKVRVQFGRLRPERGAVLHAMSELEIQRVNAVFCLHSHYDHCMDAPRFAEETRAKLVGSASTRLLGIAHGLPAARVETVGADTVRKYGGFELTFLRSAHGPPDRYPGEIHQTFGTPAVTDAWKTGEIYSVLVRHGERSLLVHGSPGFIPGALRNVRADVVYLPVGGLGKASDDYFAVYWHEVVRATRARRVIVTHWDDMFRGLEETLVPLPYGFSGLGDDFERTMWRLLRHAAEDGVEVLIPVLWQATDPFAGLNTTARQP